MINVKVQVNCSSSHSQLFFELTYVDLFVDVAPHITLKKYFTKIVICISRPRNHSLTYLQRKIVAEAAGGRVRTISRMLKDFATKVYTTFFDMIGFKSSFLSIFMTEKFLKI
jgi:hypothetical protein